MVSAPGNAFVLILALGLAPLGLVLLLLTLRGVRRGTTPHCRRCAYNLTGLTANVCPECGATCDARGVVWGARHRNRLAIVGATVVLLIGIIVSGTAGYTRYKQGNPYRYYPYFMLVSAARTDAANAVAELLRRCRAGGLSASRADELAEIALKKQSASLVPATQDWIDILLALHTADQLTDAQREAFFGQMATPTLELRPAVRAGEPMPYRILCVGRTPSLGLHAGLACTRVEVGSTWKDDCHSNLRFQAVGNSPATFGTIDIGSAPPGTYPVRCFVEQEVFQGTPAGNTDGPLVWSHETELVGEITVLPGDAPDPITRIDDPALADAIQDAIDIGPVYVDSTTNPSTYSMHAMIHSGSFTNARADLPMDVTFDVRIRLSIGEFDFGTFTGRPGANSGMGVYGRTPPFADHTATIILRANTDVARATVDLSEIWDGELVFEDVPVHHDNAN